MTKTMRTQGIRRSLGFGLVATLVASASVLLTCALPFGSIAGATVGRTVTGTPCVSQDFSNGGVCQDTITGSGFTPGQEVNVFVFRQSPALTGPSAGGGKNDLTTQVTASSGPGYPGKFSVTFDDSDIGQATQGCGGGVKFIIEAQEMNSPSVWATSTYEGYPGCLL